MRPNANDVVAELVKKHGEPARPRAERGIKQVLAMWRAEDGDEAALRKLAVEHFTADPEALKTLLARYEEAFEQLDGHLLEIGRAMRMHTDLEIGPLLPIDHLFGAFEVAAHTSEDLFQSKLAFIALLNFPLPTLDELEKDGPRWSREQWAGARLAKRFATRPSGEAEAERARAYSAAEAYIAGYNLWMHHVVSQAGARLFPRGKRLLSHWNLRDEIKAQYAEGAPGLERQRLIAAAMERIVEQTIPQQVIDDQRVDWDPVTNKVAAAPGAEIEERPKDMSAPPWASKPVDVSSAREPDTRYQMLLGMFQAARAADKGSPLFPTLLDRRFQLDSELPEARVIQLLESVAGSPVIPRIAKLIEKRLGRPLEPHDIWYAGFLPRSQHPEAKLDELTRKKYPSPTAYHDDMPRLLEAMGFAPDKAKWLSSYIVVDPSRGSGHAMPAGRRGDFPHLRTRVGKEGMDYKGYNIAVHEMGHNVEQLFSLYDVDHTLLQGVPTTAFTEALAFTFQARDLELLGLTKPDERSERLRALSDTWATYEIAGPALIDIAVWRWMYEHPKATPAELREAAVRITKETWNKWYAPVLGKKDSALIGIYSHMIAPSFIYLPEYPIGHLIQFQLETKLKGREHGREFERVSKFGRTTPDVWMMNATGQPVTAEPLLNAAAAALQAEEAASASSSR
jgi:hypothetical protein